MIFFPLAGGHHAPASMANVAQLVEQRSDPRLQVRILPSPSASCLAPRFRELRLARREGRELRRNEMDPTSQAIRECADWLIYCLRIGWKKSDLDALQSLWWQYHDEHGRFSPCIPAATR